MTDRILPNAVDPLNGAVDDVLKIGSDGQFTVGPQGSSTEQRRDVFTVAAADGADTFTLAATPAPDAPVTLYWGGLYQPPGPTTYSVSGSTIILAGGARPGDTITVDYTAPVAAAPTASMLSADGVHPNDDGMTYLADQFQATLAAAGKTPAAGTLLTAYGDSIAANDAANTPGMRAVHQLRDRLGLTLTNQAWSGYRMGDCAAKAIGTSGTFAPGTGGLVLVEAGVNDLYPADTPQGRVAIENYMRSLFAVLSAAERIEQTAFTATGTWSGLELNISTSSGGTNSSTSTDGAAATYNITTPGTYYLLLLGTDGTTRGGKFTISQGGTTLATVDLNAQAMPTLQLLTSWYGPVAVRLDNVAAGTLTMTYSTNGQPAPAYGLLDALVRIANTPPTILAVKPFTVTDPDHDKPDLFVFIRDLYDTIAAEFGPHVLVCDPEPGWVP